MIYALTCDCCRGCRGCRLFPLSSNENSLNNKKEYIRKSRIPGNFYTQKIIKSAGRYRLPPSVADPAKSTNRNEETMNNKNLDYSKIAKALEAWSDRHDISDDAGADLMDIVFDNTVPVRFTADGYEVIEGEVS